MTISRNDIEKFGQLIAEPKKIVIVSHANPDGDAIGSSLAMAEWLCGRGHEVKCVVPNRFPSFLNWMPGISELNVFSNGDTAEISAYIENAEVILCVDFNMISRLEGLEEPIEANKTACRVLVDHHQDPPEGFDINFCDPEASSTAYLVWKIITKLDSEEVITKDMADNLYVGIMTDTGNFSFSYLTPELFETVASLVRKGVDVPAVYSNVYNNFTLGRLRLLGYAIGKMEALRINGNRIAYMHLTESELRQFNFQQGDSEGFVNFPLTVSDLAMSAMFIQTRNFIRISLRSKGDVDVNRFAKEYFEGGGHKNAAGGKSYRSLPATIAYFRRCVLEFFGGEEWEIENEISFELKQ